MSYLLTPEKELAIRAKLVEILTDAGNVFVFSRRRQISSKQDFISKLTKLDVDSKAEIRYLQIDLLGFEAIEDEAQFDAECQPVRLTYGLHAFWQFADLRSDDSNSHDDFAAYLLSLRNICLDNQDILVDGLEHSLSTLTQTNFIVTGEDELTGAVGHYAKFTLPVEIRE